MSGFKEKEAGKVRSGEKARRGNSEFVLLNSELPLRASEPHTNATPELVVVREVVEMIREPASLADEVHRVCRVRAQRDAKMNHPRRGERIAARDIPKRDTGTDESRAEIAIDLAVDEDL